jgi:hypothetical protein
MPTDVIARSGATKQSRYGRTRLLRFARNDGILLLKQSRFRGRFGAAKAEAKTRL